MADPVCPKCGKPLVKRLARKGPNAGNEFWGCSGFPKCRHAESLSSDDTDSTAQLSEPTSSTPRPRRRASAESTASPAPRRTTRRVDTPSEQATSTARSVLWHDGTLRRPGWKGHHVTISGSLRSLPSQDPGSFATAFVARHDIPGATQLSGESRRVLEIWNKVLLRGMAPPIHPTSERQILEACGFGPKDFVSSLFPGDMSPRVARPYTVRTQFRRRQDRDLEDLFESDEEHSFAVWLAKSAPALIPFLTPQTSFEGILLSRGAKGLQTGCRRVDFLLTLPGSEPLVIEIDGIQHDSQTLTDSERDSLLASVGIETIRIPTVELRKGTGKNLSRILDLDANVPVSDQIDPLAWAPILLHRFTYALGEAILAGFLSGDSWDIEVDDPTGLVAASSGPYFQTFRSLATLWGAPDLIPEQVVIHSGSTHVAYQLDETGRYQSTPGKRSKPHVRIVLDVEAAPVEALPETDGVPAIVIRTACVGARISRFPTSGAARAAVTASPSDVDACLEDFLQAVFAKEAFRPGQGEAIRELLAGRDCCVLLPTGAGKSIIYQLAGLLMPGRTVIIDPIVSLIEDQVRGLRAHGIDRATGITSFTTKQGATDALLEQIADADAYFIFIAPERLQMSKTRQAITGLAVATPINLAVIDEAHCVSEWGHDFRTSYLGIGNVIRALAADVNDRPPPLVALTGTASRAVLRDVLFQLDIHEHNEHTIIRPATFDRKELRYRVLSTTPTDQEATLTGVIKTLPAAFNESLQTFYLPDGERTYSGIVFVPTVNGKSNGLIATKEIVSEVCRSVGMYSGSPPKDVPKDAWESGKRVNADRFKDNETTALVSTKAFGMGIDKPNIRWVVHYGLPGSIESYYQEVGRAGRDGQPANCVLILSEFDERRNSELLAEDVSLEEARERQNSLTWNQRDDITTALFFHVNSFPGINEEHAALVDMIGMLNPSNQRQNISVPFDSTDSRQERALHRLKILGVVSDYLKEYGSRLFDVTVEGTDPAMVKRNLIEFVERTQPGRVQEMASRVDAINLGHHETVARCGKLMIEFVYETVERSRRRSLREMLLAARQGRSDEELRRRVLDYLSEGDVGHVLESLVEETRVDLDVWVSHWQRILGRTDAAEWRASAARLLTSFPDHPGLLLSRALGEILDSQEGDVRPESVEEYASNLESALQSAVPLYKLTPNDIAKAIDWIARRVATRSEAAGALTVSIAERYDVLSPDLTTWLSDLATENEAAAIIDLDRSLIEAFHLAEATLQLTRGEQ